MGLLDFANPGQDKLTPQFLDVLNTVAGNYGGLRITSGYRDPAYNAKVGGAKGSRHTHGDASDIDLSGLSDEQRIALVNDLRGKGAKGFIAYSKSPNMLHVDMGIPGVRPNEHFMFDRSAKNMSNAPAWFQQAASGGAGTQGIADDAMAAIGKQPMQRGTQTAIGGSGADTMDTPRQGLLGQIARPDEKVGGLLGMMFGNMSPDRADQLRANIGGLMGINNQGMVDAARGRMRARSGARESDLNYARQQQQTEQERQREAQRTAQAEAWIAQNAPDEIVAAMRSGVLTPQQAYTIANKPPEGAPAAVKALEQRALLGGLEPGTPEYQQFMIDGGAKSGLALSVGSDGSVSFSAGGASVKSLTDGQAKDTVYVTRAEGALAILDQYDSNLAVLGNRMLDADPTGLVRGKLQDTDYQLARQAGDEFLQAILRKDTGAAITEPEQELYGTTYLPQPGDGPEVIAQKKQSRKRAIEAIKAGMPPSAIVAKELALLRSGDAKPDAPDGATDADGWQVIDGVRIRVKP